MLLVSNEPKSAELPVASSPMTIVNLIGAVVVEATSDTSGETRPVVMACAAVSPVGALAGMTQTSVRAVVPDDEVLRPPAKSAP